MWKSRPPFVYDQVLLECDSCIWKAEQINDENGQIYLGQWKNGMYHGRGSRLAKNPNGLKFIDSGYWEKGRLKGKGETIWENDLIYSGNYANDKKNGQGFFSWPSGMKYVGEFKDDLRHGKGTFTYADGY